MRVVSPDVDYILSKDRKTLEIILKNYDSQSATKLVRNYMRIEELEAEIKVKKDELKAELKGCDDIIDASDRFLTRVFRTRSVIWRLAKDTESTTTVMWKPAFEAIVAYVAKLMPDVVAEAEKIVKECSTVKGPTAGRLLGVEEIKDTVKEDIGNFCSDKFKEIKNDVMNWCHSYDRNLNHILQMLMKVEDEMPLTEEKTFSVNDVNKAECNLEPMKCPHCGSREVTYHAAEKDAYCAACGKWCSSELPSV